jgi:hypothetical protein
MNTAENLRISRLSTAVQQNNTVGVASASLYAANPNRVALILGSNSANRYTVSSAGTAVLDQGFTVAAAAGSQVLRVEDFGQWLTGALSVIAGGAGTTFTTIEISNPNGN